MSDACPSTKPADAAASDKKAAAAADGASLSGDQKPDASSKAAGAEDSFVFVEAPFASSEEKVLGSFFNGPSPGFLEMEQLPLQLTELTAEIEAIESSANQWDSFVESVCSDECAESLSTPTKF